MDLALIQMICEGLKRSCRDLRVDGSGDGRDRTGVSEIAVCHFVDRSPLTSVRGMMRSCPNSSILREAARTEVAELAELVASLRRCGASLSFSMGSESAGNGSLSYWLCLPCLHRCDWPRRSRRMHDVLVVVPGVEGVVVNVIV